MSGFKNFLLRGNLVDLAVAVIMGTAFAAVVAALAAWLTARLPGLPSQFEDAKAGTFAFFLNALLAFVLMAAVVYFFVVLPYTKAKERFFPSPPPGTPEDVELLRQIRDLLQQQGGGTPPTSGS